MIWLKKNLLFSVVMAVLVGILAVEIFMILGQRANARQVEADFENKVAEFRRLAGQEVLPHQRNVDLTATEIERQREEADLYVLSMQGRSGLAEAFAQHPTSRSNAFFDIAGFVDEYRARAVAAGVPAADVEDSYFGFQNYSSVGPEQQHIPQVYKQRLIVAYILDRLFEAEPENLVEVLRPGLTPDEGDEGDVPPMGGGNQAAGFRLNPRFSAELPGVVSTSAYQVVFTGRTSTLREFLNQLTSFDMPLIVRNIQVVPASQAAGGNRQQSTQRRPTRRTQRVEQAPVETQNGGATEDPGLETLVADNLSRFTVAMEFVDVHPLEDSSE